MSDGEQQDNQPEAEGHGRGPSWSLGDDYRHLRQHLAQIETQLVVVSASVISIQRALQGDQTSQNPGLAGRVDRLEERALQLIITARANSKRSRISAMKVAKLEKDVDRLSQQQKSWVWVIRIGVGAIITASATAIWALLGTKRP